MLPVHLTSLKIRLDWDARLDQPVHAQVFVIPGCVEGDTSKLMRSMLTAMSTSMLSFFMRTDKNTIVSVGLGLRYQSVVVHVSWLCSSR